MYILIAFEHREKEACSFLMLCNIDIADAVVSECLRHLRAQYSVQSSGVTRGGKGRYLPPVAALWGRQIEVGICRTIYEMSNVSGC